MQRRMLVSYRRFGTVAETSVRNCHSTLRKTQKIAQISFAPKRKPEVTRILCLLVDSDGNLLIPSWSLVTMAVRGLYI